MIGSSSTPRSFAEAVLLRAEAHPDGELVRVAGRPGWTAGALWQRTLEIARGLAGLVGPGDAVATATGGGPETIALTGALSLLGAVELAVPDGVDEGTARRLTDAVDCRLAVVSAARLRHERFLSDLGRHPRWRAVVIGPGGGGDPTLEDLVADPRPLPNTEPDLALPAAVMITSGTTGRAKGALLPNGAGLAQAQRVSAAMRYDERDVLFSFFPWQHINARHASFLPAVLSGARQVVGERFSASTFWDTARAEEVTAFNFMGAVCAILMRQPSRDGDRRHVVSRAYGGPAPAWMVRVMAERFGVQLRQAYACTELGDVALTGDEVRPGAAGRPSSDYDLRIARADLTAAPDGEVGLLLARPRGPHLTFSEYVGDRSATAAAWHDGWFRTGDHARIDDGWLYFEGRSADVIRRRGINISPEHVEETVLRLPGVADAAAVGVPSELTEDDVLVVVVPAPGTELTAQTVHRHCLERLPRHAVPRFVSLEPSLPRNASLKVLRSTLRERGLPESAWDADASPSPLEHP